MQQDKQTSVNRDRHAGKLALIVVALAAVAIAAMWAGTRDRSQVNATPTAAPTPKPFSARDAYYIARQSIEGILKAPSTAKFSDPDTDRDTGFRKIGDDRYEAWGYVDSENSFGAMLRSEWNIVMRVTDGRYQVLYAKIGDQVDGSYKKAVGTSTPAPTPTNVTIGPVKPKP